MPYEKGPIRMAEKFSRFTERWSPHVVAQLNEMHIKLTKLKGEFIWHKHDDTDELFLIHKGRLVIHYRDGQVPLAAGEMHVVPKGVEHKPVAAEECEVVLIEPAGTVNTGDAGGELTATTEPWI